jgi:acetylornithine aminotransferase/acetylornithine/N-succinyldiaminopimelate aminotransferase
MLACELDIAAPDVARRALAEQRLVLNATGPSTLRLLPPLTIGPAEVQEGLERLAGALGG